MSPAARLRQGWWSGSAAGLIEGGVQAGAAQARFAWRTAQICESGTS